MRSEERSKFGILEAMISVIVLSLKPALTSLTTSAFVIGPSFLVCACTPKAETASKTIVIRVVEKKDFIAYSWHRLRPHYNSPTPVASGPSAPFGVTRKHVETSFLILC